MFCLFLLFVPDVVFCFFLSEYIESSRTFSVSQELIKMRRNFLAKREKQQLFSSFNTFSNFDCKHSLLLYQYHHIFPYFPY